MPDPHTEFTIACQLDRIATRQAWHRVFASELWSDMTAELEARHAHLDARELSAFDVDRLLQRAEMRLEAEKRALVARLDVEPEARA